MDKKLLRTIYNICVLILLVIGAWLVVNHFVHFGDGEFTDNATVQQHITPVNTRVADSSRRYDSANISPYTRATLS